MHDEILFFAAISLIPAAMVLYKLFRNQQTFGSALGLGLMVMAIPVLAVLDIIEGRLVYPVYDIPLSFDALKLVFSILHGGLHAVSLIFGASIILLSYAMRAVLFTKAYWYFGLITGVLQIIGSYPWLTGSAFNLIVLLSFSTWLVLSGIRILSKASEMTQHNYNVPV